MDAGDDIWTEVRYIRRSRLHVAERLSGEGCSGECKYWLESELVLMLIRRTKNTVGKQSRPPWSRAVVGWPHVAEKWMPECQV